MIPLTLLRHRLPRPLWPSIAVVLCLLVVAACGRPTPAPTAGVAPAETPSAVSQATGAQTAPATPAAAPSATPAPISTPTPEPSPTATPEPIAVSIAPDVPDDVAEGVRRGLEEWVADPSNGGSRALRWVDNAQDARVAVSLVPLAEVDQAIKVAERYYAVVVPFDTLADGVSLGDLGQRFVGLSSVGILYVTPESEGALQALFAQDTHAAQVVPADEMLAHLLERRDAMGVLPFERLDPRLKVLAVDGANVLGNTFDPTTYPLAVAAVATGPSAADAAAITLPMGALTEAVAPTNRDASRLTTLIMTGVTAMSRGTAARMEAMGYAYPAEIISATLRAADITHVSNEVPFIKGCRVNNTANNLTLCSDYTYWAALEAIGTDIVGLSGNHVNDFGREGARESIQFYRDRGIPIYGSGLNVEEACAPLMWEHNGNTFAFLAALAFEPSYAWATETEPGACYYYHHKDEILRQVADLAQKVDVVAVELQYLETYQPYPTDMQVVEFRELREAGAHIVTGVQSHVPQAMEPYGHGDPGGPGIIVYGLGNLFFDQMWSWQTRTELYARHTIYDGRVIGTEILTGVLEDYAQPRWATADERIDILKRIFDAAPARPKVSAVAADPGVWVEREEERFSVRLSHPGNWRQVAGYADRYGGPEGFVQLSAMGGAELSVADACAAHANHRLQPFGSSPTIETLTVDGQEGCLILPSADQPEPMEGQAAVVVAYPEPISIGDESYAFFIIWADSDHIRRIADTVSLLR